MRCRTPDEVAADYARFRGRCRELSEQAASEDPTLAVKRGYYHCPFFGKQGHWWCVRKDGTIVDPTALQFPSAGRGMYEEFDGFFECEECGKTIHEAETVFAGTHPVCSLVCYGRLVGLG